MIFHMVLHSLKLTASLPVKKMVVGQLSESFPFGVVYFQGLLLLVSGSVTMES